MMYELMMRMSEGVPTRSAYSNNAKCLSMWRAAVNDNECFYGSNSESQVDRAASDREIAWRLEWLVHRRRVVDGHLLVVRVQQRVADLHAQTPRGSVIL